MKDPGRASAYVAVTLGIIGLGSWISLIVFFIVGGPFGAINDVGNGALALLSGALAVMTWRSGAAPGPANGAVVISVALLGATVAVIGSALILSDTTGFFLAGLVSSTGFALIGVWLHLLNRWIASNGDQGWPARRLTLGKLAGAVMALGIISIAGAVMGLDDMGAAPVWVHVGGISWLGTYILFPVWSIWFGRALAEQRPPGTETGHLQSAS